MKKEHLPELISEIRDELEMVERVTADIGNARREMKGRPELRTVYEESLRSNFIIFIPAAREFFIR